MKTFLQKKIWIAFIVGFIFFGVGRGYALEPDEILIVANSDIKESVRIAHYYCAKRAVPEENILVLPLGVKLSDTISRSDYEKLLAEPIRNKLYAPEFAGRIKCLLTTYGVPIKVGKRAPLKERKKELKQLQELLKAEETKLEQLRQSNPTRSDTQQKDVTDKIYKLKLDINPIIGIETNASVDSELSMVLSEDYELYRWQPNNLMGTLTYWDFKTLMV